MRIPWKRRTPRWMWCLWAVASVAAVSVPTAGAAQPVQWYWDTTRAEIKLEARPFVVQAECRGFGLYLQQDGMRLWRRFACHVWKRHSETDASLLVTGRHTYHVRFVRPNGAP